ncbi:PDR/VanB family oxidoreductase [Microbacterium dextranolyticum]|uniref:Ferredoxin n=1 Tax=Microbacterium dextranolyticum TaxID=36806 RepID=A0A9W6HMD6_9MICO|nr:PDR/VanB family oxidoreductase [Microbacterium dextranolyticum]MBM7462949.1 ferredoxin-NADP reductase [Microbacterium dextranolyticum]GLJ95945.1 ferredoxin [Microbacterium dextranolyticum]
MSAPEGRIEVEVVAIEAAADGIVEIELAARAGDRLPDWEPGAHIDLILPSGLVRQYSLTGEPAAATWRVAVLREEAGRGGSRWIADRLQVGARLKVAGPRNHFALPPANGAAAPLVFVAGGIGITPIVPLAAQALGEGREVRVHYCGHEGRMAFLDRLHGLYGDRFTVHISERGDRLDIDALVVDAAASGAAIVTCGPARLLDAIGETARAHDVPVHLERFESGALPAPVWQGPFEVELALTGVTIEVPPEISVLAAAEAAGALVLSSCSEGTCGTCETPVLDGVVDHRDSILSPAQRERNDTMFVCVSRAACPRLVLEL